MYIPFFLLLFLGSGKFLFAADHEQPSPVLPRLDLTALPKGNEKLHTAEVREELQLSIQVDTPFTNMQKIKRFERRVTCNDIVDDNGNNLFQQVLLRNKSEVAEFILQSTGWNPELSSKNLNEQNSYDLLIQLDAHEPRLFSIKLAIIDSLRTERRIEVFTALLNDGINEYAKKLGHDRPIGEFGNTIENNGSWTSRVANKPSLHKQISVIIKRIMSSPRKYLNSPRKKESCDEAESDNDTTPMMASPSFPDSSTIPRSQPSSVQCTPRSPDKSSPGKNLASLILSKKIIARVEKKNSADLTENNSTQNGHSVLRTRSYCPQSSEQEASSTYTKSKIVPKKSDPEIHSSTTQHRNCGCSPRYKESQIIKHNTSNPSTLNKKKQS